MRRLLILGLAVVAIAPFGPLTVSAASAPASEYDRDVVSVVTLGRHSDFPTANCLVWANAEGLGVGPAQLNGLHGVTMNINLHPLPQESAKQPTSFAAGLAELKARFPTVPAWLIGVLEKHQAAIEAVCAEDHDTPFTVHAITSKDKG